MKQTISLQHLIQNGGWRVLTRGWDHGKIVLYTERGPTVTHNNYVTIFGTYAVLFCNWVQVNGQPWSGLLPNLNINLMMILVQISERVSVLVGGEGGLAHPAGGGPVCTSIASGLPSTAKMRSVRRCLRTIAAVSSCHLPSSYVK